MAKGDLTAPPAVIGGTVWTITVTSSKSVKGLRGNEGLCDASKHHIYINADIVPKERHGAVRFHEECHASGDLSEARWAMQHLLKVSSEEMIEIEEHFIRLYGSAMFAQLVANGHLHYPEFQTVETDDTQEDSHRP